MSDTHKLILVGIVCQLMYDMKELVSGGNVRRLESHIYIRLSNVEILFKHVNLVTSINDLLLKTPNFSLVENDINKIAIALHALCKIYFNRCLNDLPVDELNKSIPKLVEDVSEMFTLIDFDSGVIQDISIVDHALQAYLKALKSLVDKYNSGVAPDILVPSSIIEFKRQQALTKLIDSVNKRWISDPATVCWISWFGTGTLSEENPTGPEIITAEKSKLYLPVCFADMELEFVNGFLNVVTPRTTSLKSSITPVTGVNMDSFSRTISAKVANSEKAITDLKTYGGLSEKCFELVKTVQTIDGVSTHKFYTSSTNVDVATLNNFVRFVKICAEPSAQSAWMIMAQDAVMAGAKELFVSLQDKSDDFISKMLISGRLAACVAYATIKTILPYSLAVVTSAISSYSYGGCAGAWVGLLPLSISEQFLKEQQLVCGDNGFLLRIGKSKPCDVAVTNCTSTGITHEYIPVIDSGYIFMGKIYPGLSQLIIANTLIFEHPCLDASLAIIGWAKPEPVIKSLEHDIYDLKYVDSNSTTTFELLEQEVELYSSVNSGLHYLYNSLADNLANYQTGQSILKLIDKIGHGDFLLPKGVFTHMCSVIDYKLHSVFPLPGVISPESLSTTIVEGPLPIPEMHILPSCIKYNPTLQNSLYKYAFPYNHGFLKYDEALLRLKDKPPGTFLFRSSQSQKGSAVLAFVDTNNAVQQSIIAPNGDQVSCSGNTFPDLKFFMRTYMLSPGEGKQPLLIKGVRLADTSVHMVSQTIDWSFSLVKKWEMN